MGEFPASAPSEDPNLPPGLGRQERRFIQAMRGMKSEKNTKTFRKDVSYALD